MESKHFLLSKTFWAGVVVVVASLAGVFGIEPDKLPNADEIVAIIAGVVTIVGRFTAKTALRV